MSHRISKGGTYRIDRRFAGVGRIARASGTTNQKVFRRLDAMLSELYEDGHIDVLRGIKSGAWTLQEVYQAKRAGRVPYLAAELALHRNLWSAVDEWLPTSAPAESSRKRYATSFHSLQKLGVVPANASILSLREIDWSAVQTAWSGGPADWNRFRSAVSRFLTMTLGDKYHPFRREVIAAIPRAREPMGRVPDLPVDLFWRIVNDTPEHVRPAYVTIAAAGLRPGEYLELQDHHLRPHTRSIEVPGTKTRPSHDVVTVGEEAWKWVRAAVPAPVRYKWLRIHWKRACERQGSPELTLHDLRHFYGQMLTEEGRPEVSVQAGLRHASPDMTRRYARQRDKGENAAAMDRLLFERPGGEEEQKEA